MQRCRGRNYLGWKKVVESWQPNLCQADSANLCICSITSSLEIHFAATPMAIPRNTVPYRESPKSKTHSACTCGAEGYPIRHPGQEVVCPCIIPAPVKCRNIGRRSRERNELHPMDKQRCHNWGVTPGVGLGSDGPEHEGTSVGVWIAIRADGSLGKCRDHISGTVVQKHAVLALLISTSLDNPETHLQST